MQLKIPVLSEKGKVKNNNILKEKNEYNEETTE